MPAVTGYKIALNNSSGNWTGIVSRNSTTSIVDATSGAPNRLVLPDPLDPGANGPLAVATITAATNATPIVLTNTLDNGTFADGDWVSVRGALGNTNANGTFLITSTSGSGTGMTLVGSAGNAAWTSGGKVYKLNVSPTLSILIQKIIASVLSDYADNGN